MVRNEAEMALEYVKGLLMIDHASFGENSDYTKLLVTLLNTDNFLTSIALNTPEGYYFSISRPDNCELDRPEKIRYSVKKITRRGSTCTETDGYATHLGEFVESGSKQTRCAPRSELKEPSENEGKIWEVISSPIGENPIMQVTVSDIAKDENDKIIFGISATLTTKKLASILLKETVGKTGFALIINNQGEIVIPNPNNFSPKHRIRKELFAKAFEAHKTSGSDSFDFDFKGDPYISSFGSSFTFRNCEWKIAVIVPFNDFFGDIRRTEITTRLVSLLIFILCGFITYFSAKFISRPIVALDAQVNQIRQFDFTEPLPIRSGIKEILDLDRSIKAMRSALKSFGRYVPKEVVKALISGGREVSLGGERLEITIMFSDVRDFTTISENLSIDKLMPIFGDYFDVMSKIVLSNEGTIDKYIGDSLMAFWGAPLKVENHPAKACLTALHCLRTVNLEKKWTTRFGIHTGEALVGNIGTKERMNYTVIGDSVNIASRLESINKEYDTSIIISLAVQEKIGTRFITRPIDFVAVKGKRKKLKIFELMGMTDGSLAASKEQITLSKKFTAAYDLYEKGRTEEAYEAFASLGKEFPSDVPTKKYISLLAKN